MVLEIWTESHSPRGIDAASHHCVACKKRNVTIDRCPSIKSSEIRPFLEVAGLLPSANSGAELPDDSKPCGGNCLVRNIAARGSPEARPGFAVEIPETIQGCKISSENSRDASR